MVYLYIREEPREQRAATPEKLAPSFSQGLPLVTSFAGKKRPGDDILARQMSAAIDKKLIIRGQWYSIEEFANTCLGSIAHVHVFISFGFRRRSSSC